MSEWKSDDEFLQLIRDELYTAVVGDICDELGLTKQFLPQNIQHISTHIPVPVMAGRAMTVLEVDVFSELGTTGPFGCMLQALDDLKKNEIYICAGASKRYATIGELMCTAMIVRGAVGAISDSFIRDIEGIRALTFPVFSSGFYGQDQKGRGVVLDYRVPIEIGGIQINDGDLLVGDIDGVLVVPKEKEDVIITAALEKARGEKMVQKKIQEGMLASEAFDTYGIM